MAVQAAFDFEQKLPLEVLLPMLAESRERVAGRLAELREVLVELGAAIPARPGMRVEPAQFGGVRCEWVRPADEAAPGVILYFHGGAFVAGSPETHRGLAADLAFRARVPVLSVDYSLAPEAPFPAAQTDALSVYEAVIAAGIPPKRIAVAGDSAGGNLALGLLLRAQAASLPLPAGAALLSPWVNLAGGSASYTINAAADRGMDGSFLLRMAGVYAGSTPLTEPSVSPLFADLSGLPPLLLHAGDNELLRDDVADLARRAQAAGTKVQLVVWPRMFHGWHIFHPFLEEARRANEAVSLFLRELLAPSAGAEGAHTHQEQVYANDHSQ